MIDRKKHGKKNTTLHGIRNYLEVVDIFKEPQVIPFIKSKEKEKGSILGGILTIALIITFTAYVITLLSYFVEPYDNDNYSVLQNL